ncbi:unnamed protein product, partial [Urochloa humidicola]
AAASIASLPPPPPSRLQPLPRCLYSSTASAPCEVVPLLSRSRKASWEPQSRRPSGNRKLAGCRAGRRLAHVLCAEPAGIAVISSDFFISKTPRGPVDSRTYSSDGVCCVKFFQFDQQTSMLEEEL